MWPRKRKDAWSSTKCGKHVKPLQTFYYSNAPRPFTQTVQVTSYVRNLRKHTHQNLTDTYTASCSLTRRAVEIMRKSLPENAQGCEICLVIKHNDYKCWPFHFPVHLKNRPSCQGGFQGCGKQPQRPPVAIPSTLPRTKDSQIHFVFTNACQSPASTDTSRQACSHSRKRPDPESQLFSQIRGAGAGMRNNFQCEKQERNRSRLPTPTEDDNCVPAVSYYAHLHVFNEQPPEFSISVLALFLPCFNFVWLSVKGRHKNLGWSQPLYSATAGQLIRTEVLQQQKK